MKSLEQLFLNDNQLEGGIPKSLGDICTLRNTLRKLYLSSNNLNGQVLDFFHNLQGCAKDSLEGLHLGRNQIAGFDWFPPFQLIDLYLRSCKLGPDFPNWIRTQRNLIFLDLSNTGISNTIPTWSWHMPFELNYLNLSRNQIKGRLPNASSIFSDLAILDLSSNRFEGPLPVISSNLSSLNLSKNKLSGISGTIPQCLDNLIAMAHKISNAMTNKYFIWNGLEYSFYTDYGSYSGNSVHIIVGWKGNVYEYGKNFGEMRSIDLANNKLTRNIPEGISNLIELKALNLLGNTLTGIIPKNIGKLEQLESLDLSRNRFSGSLPASMNSNRNSAPVLRPSKFMGNAGFCGPPLIEKSPKDLKSNIGGSKSHQEDPDEFWNCLYVTSGDLRPLVWCRIILADMYARRNLYVYKLGLG
ncbi:receptor-like protein eix2 [Quercus suber]|uniref:Receptor-like protein eix2 n=1 Tax=Quercus suber TaxID=58331 RepID=A0AAW0KND2_QUESU